MKKTKVIIPALGMLLLSTAASVTGTVAWFTANKTVTASGMQIKAKAEDGIVINNDAFATNNWKTSVGATHTTAVELNPTSTADGTAWYHATSDDMDSHEKEADTNYENPTVIVDSTETSVTYVDGATGGVGFVDSTTGEKANDKFDSDVESAYYLVNDFYIKSSSNELANQHVYINKVKAKVAGTAASEDLNKALRVLVKVEGTKVGVYAPFAGATTSYKVNNTTDVTVESVKSGTTVADGIYNTDAGTYTIPANNVSTKAGCIEVACYAYFEGEDANCKSANIKDTLDTLQLDFQFGLKTVAE